MGEDGKGEEEGAKERKEKGGGEIERERGGWAKTVRERRRATKRGKRKEEGR